MSRNATPSITNGKDASLNQGIIEDDAVKHRLIEDDVLKWNPLDIWAEDGDAERIVPRYAQLCPKQNQRQ